MNKLEQRINRAVNRVNVAEDFAEGTKSMAKHTLATGPIAGIAFSLISVGFEKMDPNFEPMLSTMPILEVVGLGAIAGYIFPITIGAYWVASKVACKCFERNAIKLCAQAEKEKSAQEATMA